MESLLRDFNVNTLEAYVSKLDYLKPFTFQKYFPFKKWLYITYESLIGQIGAPVAGDVVTWDSSAPEKSRRVLGKVTGEIPPIRLKRTLSEKKRLQYSQFQSAGLPAEALKLIFEDIDYCAVGCLARLEWLTFQVLSKGSISLTKSNNAGRITTDDIDFQMPAANKRVIESGTSNRKWGTGSVSEIKPITDIEVICKFARDAGVRLRYILMSEDTFLIMKASDEVRELQWGASTGSITIPYLPSRVTAAQLNTALLDNGLPEIIVYSNIIDLENENHEITSVSAWENKYVLFIPEIECGSTLLAPIAEELSKPPQVIQVKVNGVLISRWSEIDPMLELTKGEVNAFPVWNSIDRCFRLDIALNDADGKVD